MPPSRSGRWSNAWRAALLIMSSGALGLITVRVIERRDRPAHQPGGTVARPEVAPSNSGPLPTDRPPVAAPRPPAAHNHPPIAEHDATASSAALGPAAKSRPSVAPADPLPVDLPVTGGAFSPSFDTTGSAFFFHAGRDRDGQLLEADLDPKGLPLRIVTVLADRGRNYHPRLSPDARSVAFDSDRDGERGVYIADRNGTDVRRVSGAGFAAVPSWSPDGRWLAFVRAEPDQPRVWNLWLRNQVTGEQKRLTSYRVGQMWGGSWFPDSRRLCFSHEEHLVILDLQRGVIDRFQSPRRARLVRTPAVSPDGSRIIFQVHGDGVWMLDINTRWMHRIFSDPTAEEFAWDPNGTRVAYHSRRDGQWRIWITSPPA